MELEYSYSTTQLDLPSELARLVRFWTSGYVFSQDLHPTEVNGPDIHVTVLYGIKSSDPMEVVNLTKGFGPIQVVLGKSSIFRNEKFDVLKLDVISPRLHELHKILVENIENKDEHPEYVPHCTCAYLLPGTGDQYVGSKFFEGMSFVSRELSFRGHDSVRVNIKL